LSTEEFNNNSLSLYPNPVYGNVVQINSNENLSFEIYNILGKLVLSGNSQNGMIQLGQMNKGVYLIKLKTNKGILTKKLIKQ